MHSRRQFIRFTSLGISYIANPVLGNSSFFFNLPKLNESIYTFVNVGFGDTCVLNLGGRYVMVDCYKSMDCGENFTDYINNNTVELLILTHRHYDHYFGIDELFTKNIHVKEAWESAYMGHKNKKQYKNVVDSDVTQGLKTEELTAKLAVNGTKFERPISDHTLHKTINGFKFYILNPTKTINSDYQNTTHDGCLVVKLVNPNDENEILFCGDTSIKSLERILEEEDIANTRILCSSHHGAIDSLHKEFVKKVNPEYTIISSKPGVWREIPEKESLDFYAANSRKGILKTYEGTIQLSGNL